VTPLELDVDDVLSFVIAALPPPPATVLEVGAGDGRLAARLRERGFSVAAIDVDDEAVAAARARGVAVERADVLEFRGGPFDAVIFTRSFHHVWPLDAAVASARALLAPRGALVLDEFAHDEIDLQSATWFYDVQALLEQTGALAADERRHRHGHGHGHDQHHAEPPKTPLERWQRRVAHDPPLHGGQAMLAALGAAFDLTHVAKTPYLHRYFADRLAADADGARLFGTLRELEQQRLALGLLVPVGLRIVAKSR
jgi:SAM-dependent methyltransferase